MTQDAELPGFATLLRVAGSLNSESAGSTPSAANPRASTAVDASQDQTSSSRLDQVSHRPGSPQRQAQTEPAQPSWLEDGLDGLDGEHCDLCLAEEHISGLACGCHRMDWTCQAVCSFDRHMLGLAL